MKQMISLFIAASLLASLAACGSGAAETQDSSDNTVVASSTETPEVKYDFGGREYRILCRTDKSYEFDIKEPNGDIVDDAVYERNLKIENECNISIKPITADGNWDSREIFMNLIASSVLAGEDAYDLVAGYNAYIATLITHGYLIDMNIMGIDFSSPWWYAGFNDNVSIGGKMFFCLGDASLTMWENLEVVLFNRSLIRDFNLTSPYELVNNDEWYFDTMRRMCADISSDLNQDGAYKENDRWGMIFYNKRDLAVYLGNSYCTFDADGYPVLSLYNERLVDQYAEIYDFLNTSNEARQFVPDTDQLIFSEGRALFFQAPLRYAELLRDSEVDFGMLPFPKYDETQDRYYTTVVDDLSVFCIPITITDPLFCGIILDMLCRESSELVVPNYYDKALKHKYTRDTESEEMLNLARETIWFDFGFVYSQALNDLGSFLDILSSTPNISSAWASRKSAYEAGLESLIDCFKEN